MSHSLMHNTTDDVKCDLNSQSTGTAVIPGMSHIPLRTSHDMSHAATLPPMGWFVASYNAIVIEAACPMWQETP